MKQEKKFYGKNIVYDKQDRLIYMDPRSKDFYVITDREVRALYLLQNRLYLSIMAAAVAYFYLKDILRVCAILIICYFGLSLAYKKMFLPRLEKTVNLTKEDLVLPDTTVSKEDLEPQTAAKVIMTSVLSLIVGILFVVNAQQSAEMSQMIKFLHYGLATATVLYGIVNLFVLSKVMKK